MARGLEEASELGLDTLHLVWVFAARDRRLRVVAIERDPRFQLRFGQHPGINQAFNARMQPLLVIARGEICCRVHLLDTVAGAAWNRHWGGDAQGEHTPFPVVVKHWFVLLPHDGTEPVHASHIVNTVHAASPVRLGLPAVSHLATQGAWMCAPTCSHACTFTPFARRRKEICRAWYACR